MVDDYEFNKQFKNLGIDHESVKNASKIMSQNKDESNSNGNDVSNKNHEERQSEDHSNEIAILKRKIDYFTNNLLPKIEEKFQELDNKIERYASEWRDNKKDYIVLRNDLDDVKKRIRSARVVFGDEWNSPNVHRSSGSLPTSTKDNENMNTSSIGSSGSSAGDESPEDVRIDKIFNYSNHKF